MPVYQRVQYPSPVSNHPHPVVAKRSPSPTSLDMRTMDIIYTVQFKRKVRFYVPSQTQQVISIGDYVKVKADRGEDLGLVIDIIPSAVFHELRALHSLRPSSSEEDTAWSLKPIICIASSFEVKQLALKTAEEFKVIENCSHLANRVNALPMVIVDAEFQYDRQKLIIYYDSNIRIDFREFVRDVFTLYRTRIWMQQINNRSPLQAHPRAMTAGTPNVPVTATRQAATRLPAYQSHVQPMGGMYSQPGGGGPMVHPMHRSMISPVHHHPHHQHHPKGMSVFEQQTMTPPLQHQQQQQQSQRYQQPHPSVPMGAHPTPYGTMSSASAKPFSSYSSSSSSADAMYFQQQHHQQQSVFPCHAAAMVTGGLSRESSLFY